MMRDVLLEEMVREDMRNKGYNPYLLSHIEFYWMELLG